jgi:hypothetical protein
MCPGWGRCALGFSEESRNWVKGGVWLATDARKVKNHNRLGSMPNSQRRCARSRTTRRVEGGAAMPVSTVLSAAGQAIEPT